MIVNQRQELILRPEFRSRLKSDFITKLRLGRGLLATNCDGQTLTAFSAATSQNSAPIFSRHASAETVSCFAALVPRLIGPFAHLKYSLWAFSLKSLVLVITSGPHT
jgi:hypothetical protein